MKKSLIIAEKPSVGRDIARVLGCHKNNQSFIEGDKYIVTWALGHLVTLADPEAYDKRYATWKLDDLPIIPGKMKLIVMKGSGKQFATIKKTDWSWRCQRYYYCHRCRSRRGAGSQMDTGKGPFEKAHQTVMDIICD